LENTVEKTSSMGSGIFVVVSNIRSLRAKKKLLVVISGDG
jgi:hypothetical protein